MFDHDVVADPFGVGWYRGGVEEVKSLKMIVEETAKEAVVVVVMVTADVELVVEAHRALAP